MQKTHVVAEGAVGRVHAPARLRIGSEEHKQLFCRTFLDSHAVYEPRDLPWPQLDEHSLAFLRSVPVWTLALEVEVNAGMMLDDFAATQGDELIAQALELQAYEEARHGRMLDELIERYGLRAGDVHPSADRSREAFVVFGYNECLDSFLGFGIFRLACETRTVPEPLTMLFERVLIEEARHIVFFVNWIAYDRCKRGLNGPALQAIPVAMGYLSALKKTLGRARKTTQGDKGIAAAGGVFSGLTLSGLLKTCLEEERRYMAAFDPRLLRPRVIPSIARVVCAMANALQQ